MNFAARNGVQARWYYINISHDLIVNQMKALIARDLWDMSEYFQVINLMNNSMLKAVELLEKPGMNFPERK